MLELKRLYKTWRGDEPESVERIAGAGSNRKYWRLTCADGRESVIGCCGTSKEENKAFLTLARHFRRQGISVPEVYAVSADEMYYLQEDLGSLSLYDAIKSGREKGGEYSREEEALLVRTIRELPKIQFLGAEGLDFGVCYPKAEWDTESIFFDLNYFKYCFLKPTDLDFNETLLEKDFREFASLLNGVPKTEQGFLYRDFQARNVMLDGKDNPHFIDFQGGRRGPCYYDLASFLFQAAAHYSKDLRLRLTKEYFDVLCEVIGKESAPDWDVFQKRLNLFALMRTLQVLGAYGFRGNFEHKEHFIKSIPPAIENLRGLLQLNLIPECPYLTDVLRRMTGLKQFASKEKPKENGGGLIVRVYSFSYRRGIPEDETGNGGGYVFDCRSTHNPGRYEPYKQLTGLDEPVKRFLEDDGEITEFLKSVYKLADTHTARYIERGFQSLMFSFGCTGGQHRSVYAAEHLAEHLNSKFGIEVRLTHREQDIKRTLPKR